MNFINMLLLIIFFTSISSLHRSLYLDKERCFYDNYYTNMNIIINYKILDNDIIIPATDKNIFKIYITSMEKGNTYKLFYGNKLSGKFSYNIEQSDKFKICIYTNDKDLFKNKRFLSLQFQVQSKEEAYDPNTAKGKDFQKVNNTMTRLDGKVETIEHMQSYQIELEDKFSKAQINSSTRLALLSFCQILVICIVGVFHVFYLRKIFKDKIWTPF